MSTQASPRIIGRYMLYGEIAAGGMATVHFGRLSGPSGFSRTVAIKRLHPQYAKDPEFVSMFMDEALLAARIRHPNVVTTLDVVATADEIFLVMEYVQGESLARLVRGLRSRMTPADTRIVATIMSGVLHGLHAAHEARDEQGAPLHIVHRDVSPQNVLVGVDGVPRVLDFGVAKAAGRVQTTREGQLKGKIAYMAPEQLHGAAVTRQTDVYAAAVVAWEAVTGKRLFQFDNEAAMVTAILQGGIDLPSQAAPHVPTVFDRVIMRGLERDMKKRYRTAREMAIDLEKCVGIASSSEVGDWVERLASTELVVRANRIAEIESTASRLRGSLPSLADLAATVEAPTMPPPAPAVPAAPAAHPLQSVIPTELRSDLSSIAVSPESARHPLRRRKRTVLVAGIAAAALLLATLVIVSMRSGTPEPAVVASGGASISAPALSVPSALAPAASAEAPPAVQPAAVVSAVPAATDATAPPAAWRRRYVPPPTGALPAPTAKPATAPADCDPPFTIDDKGHKHYKPACLQ